MTDDKMIWELKYLAGLSSSEAEDCLVSRNAIIPVIEKALNNEETKLKFCEALWHLVGSTLDNKYPVARILVKLLCSTPKQLSIALLKATGKWTEE